VPPDLLLEAVVMARAPACRRNRAWAPTRLQPFVVSERLGSVDPTVIQLVVVVHMLAVAVLAEVHRVPQLGTRHPQINEVVWDLVLAVDQTRAPRRRTTTTTIKRVSLLTRLRRSSEQRLMRSLSIVRWRGSRR